MFRASVAALLIGAALLAAAEDVIQDAQYYEGDPEHQFDDVLPSELTSDLQVEDDLTWGRSVARRVGYAVGDPHFRTFDGNVYHFQSVGQFVLNRGPNQEIQGRTFSCGRHNTYGYVTCWNEAAVKFTNPKTKKTSIVQINTRGRCTIKHNGETVKDHKAAFTTAAGSEIRPTTLTVNYFNGRHTVNYKVCMVKVLHPDGSGAFVAPYAIYSVEPVDHKTKGLMGNNDGNPHNDFINGQNGMVYNLKTAADKLDNGRTGKKLHEWGNSWEVDDDKYKSIFDDAAKKYNKPQFKPGEFPFTNKTFKAEAHAACLNSALTMDFYVDCMFDCAATNSLDAVGKDAEANEMFKEFKQKHKNYHKGKAALIRTLMKMNVEFKVEQRHIKEAGEKQAEEVAKLKNHWKAAKDQQAHSCGAIHGVRAHLEKAKQHFEKAKGAKAYIDKKWTETLQKWQKDTDQNAREKELITQMKKVLGDLVNVKTTSDLEVDQEQLAKAPKLKETFQELIDRAHSGHTDRIGALLDTLLENLAKEKKAMDANKAAVHADRVKVHRYYHLMAAAVKKGEDMLAKQKRECDRAKDKANAKYGEYKTGLDQQAEDEEERAAETEELQKEIEMIASLKEAIVNWSSSKKFSVCKKSLEEADIDMSDDSAHGLDPQEVAEFDKTLPVAEDEHPSDELDEDDANPAGQDHPSAPFHDEEDLEDLSESDDSVPQDAPEGPEDDIFNELQIGDYELSSEF